MSPGARPNGQSLAVELLSSAAAMAVRRVAARTRTSRSSIVLTAICAVVARRACYRELVFPVLSTWTRVMEASRHARCDEVKLEAVGELIEHERGLRLTSDPMYNSVVPESWSGLTAGVGFEPEEIDVALARDPVAVAPGAG